MAVINITIPDAQIPRIRAAFQKYSGDPNYGLPELKAFLAAQIKGVVLAQEQKDAAETAQAAVTPVDVT